MATYFVEAEGPQARAQSSANLLASAAPSNSGDWENGLSFLGEGCPSLQVFDPCEETTVDGDPSMGAVTFLSPLAYRMWTECSTLDVNGDIARARLARQADAVASFAIARELAEGAGTIAHPFADPFGNTGVVNPYFADGNAEDLPAAASLLQGLGALEQAARDKTKGMQVFLHIPIVIATQVAAQLFRVGNELRTATDAVVIADAGYTGRGALDAGTQETQTVTITGGPTGGSFTLNPLGIVTGAIAWNATAAAVQTALRTATGRTDITVTGANGGPYTVKFPAALGNVAQMAGVSSLTGGTAPAVVVATTTPGVAPAPVAGTWGYATGPIFTRLGSTNVEDDPRQTITRRTNRRTLWADRLFAAGYDPCASVAIQFPEPV